NGREAMVVDLGGSIGKVAVATRNLGATDVNDYGTSFSAEDALDPDKNGLTDGWYVPSMEELVALSENLKDNDDKDSKYGLEWQVSETATLYVPATILIYGEYGGFYMSSSQNKSILAFIYDTTKGLTKMVVDNQVTTYPQFAIRPFHKLPTKNQCLFYTSSDGNVVTPNEDAFNVNIVSNTYENGKGVITFSEELTSIGEDAFYLKGTLTSMTFPASLKSIGNYAFNGCGQLSSLTFAEGSQLETIGEGAFNETSISGHLTYLPASLKSIGASAFKATKLNAVTLPASVTSIGDYAFNGCSSLATLTFAEDSQLETIGVAAFNSTAISGELTLPASLKTIRCEAFGGCRQLSSLTFAEGSQLETIEDNAFSGTLISGELTLPASLKTIGNVAFSGCSQLSSLTFAEGTQLETIGEFAFAGTSISGELTIPASVKSIGREIFGGCKLTKVYISVEDLSNVSKFSFINNVALIIVTPILYEAYKSLFKDYNKVEVEPFSDWQEYTIAQIKAAMKTANTISDTDKTTIAGYISTIEDATTFDEATTAYYTALALIDKQKAFEEKVKDVFNTLGTKQDGPAIEIVGEDGQTFQLYKIKNVKFIKVSTEK
ncbi:MAG: leucine-rich repeat domain-containing protein, partial [Bacteroidales bacterium]|nr:leucine-rich repeat domain-containing protein [Bacteroidales bacterium]